MTLSIFLTKLLAFADQVLLLLWRVVTFVGRTACDISLLIIETVQSIRIKGTPIRESQFLKATRKFLDAAHVIHSRERAGRFLASLQGELDRSAITRRMTFNRGPYHGSRIIDLSEAAAKELGVFEQGVAEVELFIRK